MISTLWEENLIMSPSSNGLKDEVLEIHPTFSSLKTTLTKHWVGQKVHLDFPIQWL